MEKLIEVVALVQRRVLVPVTKFIMGRKIDWGRELVGRIIRVPVRKIIMG